MPQRPRRPRRNQRRIGFESLESRQVLTAAFVDVDPDLWAWDAGADSADIVADSWVASDGWNDDSWGIDDGSWVDDTWWNDEGSWSNDDWWVTANWSGDDSAVGTDVGTAVVDVGVDGGSGLQAVITVDAGSTVAGAGAGGEWNAFAPEETPSPEAAAALETFDASLEPRDAPVEFFSPAELASEPVTEVVGGSVSEGLTDVTVAAVTSDTTAGDQYTTVLVALSSEAPLGSSDPDLGALDETAVAEWDDPVAVFDDPVAVFDEPVAVVDDPVAVFDEPVAVFDEPVAVFDEPVAVFDDPVAVFDEPVAELDEPVAELDEPVAELDEPVAELDDPVAVVDDPVAVVDDPVAVVDDPVAVVDDPVAVVDDPVAVVPSTPLPAGRTPAKTQSVAGRFTSWAGMFMQGFGGFSASSDAASLSDSEIPGRGRSRSRLPFRPAN